jgi:hypothetical protein
MGMGRPLRADAERSVRAILEAAERVLVRTPESDALVTLVIDTLLHGAGPYN